MNMFCDRPRPPSHRPRPQATEIPFEISLFCGKREKRVGGLRLILEKRSANPRVSIPVCRTFPACKVLREIQPGIRHKMYMLRVSSV